MITDSGFKIRDTVRRGDLIVFSDNGKRRVGNYVKKEVPGVSIRVKMFSGGIWIVPLTDIID